MGASEDALDLIRLFLLCARVADPRLVSNLIQNEVRWERSKDPLHMWEDWRENVAENRILHQPCQGSEAEDLSRLRSPVGRS